MNRRETPVSKDIRELVGVDFPLFAFSHCRDVVAAVSRAGGFGVLGAVSHTPEELELELRWLDEAVVGKPYGVDILIPDNQQAGRGVTAEQLLEQIPSKHRDFVTEVLRSHDVTPPDFSHPRLPPTLPEVGETYLDIAFRHPIRLIVNALGTASASMLERGNAHGVPVAALVGAKEHALKQVAAGVDILVAQGGEAGGHCGEVTTMVLVPEVIKAVEAVRPVPVLAAGGIMTGRQMAAFGLARDTRIRGFSGLPRKDGSNLISRHNSLQISNREVQQTVAIRMARPMGRSGQSRSVAHAVDEHAVYTSNGRDKQRGRLRQPKSV
jgi:hypothetical protein